MSSSTSTSSSVPTTASGVEIRNRDMLSLRHYITSKDSNPYDGMHVSTVLLDLTHSNLLQKHIEIRFDKHDTLDRLQERIHQKTGTPPHFQHLQFKSAGQIWMEVPPDVASQQAHFKLGYFFDGGMGDATISMGYEVHCVDLNPNSGSKGGQYEDTSLVEKYVMTEEAYDQRKGTLRDWGREQKAKDDRFTLARHAREHRELADAVRQHKLGLELPMGFVLDSTGKVIRDEPDDDASNTICNHEDSNPNGSGDVEKGEHDEESVLGIEVGMRCQVQPGSRRGTVSYVGLVPELVAGGGFWVGITFDEPVGRTDGSITCKEGGGKKQYFVAELLYASFVRGKNVEVGDFPELDLFDEDESDDEL
jgi:tubulin-folding cofactor B